MLPCIVIDFFLNNQLHALIIPIVFCYKTLHQLFSNCGPRTTSGPFRLNISPKKTEKNKINVNCVSHTIDENLKQSLEIIYNKRL